MTRRERVETAAASLICSRLPGLQVRSATREGETRGSELLARGGRPAAPLKMEYHYLQQHQRHSMNPLPYLPVLYRYM